MVPASPSVLHQHTRRRRNALHATAFSVGCAVCLRVAFGGARAGPAARVSSGPAAGGSPRRAYQAAFLESPAPAQAQAASRQQAEGDHGGQHWEDSFFEFGNGTTTCAVGITRSGAGPRVLLLPALSSISTRRELQGLQEFLAGSGHETVSVDWPGFGVGAKRAVNWTPDLYEAFLVKVLTDIAPSPSLVVAAGHAAGYVLRVAGKLPDAFGHAVFVSPTWRGPAPTVLNGERPTWLRKVLRLVDIPGLGSLFYRLNVNDLSVRLMTGRHVYSQAGWLDSGAGRMRSKHAVISSRGARHASVRFVTGMLDPFESTAAFVAAAEALKFRIMVVIGGEMPAKSRTDVLTLMRILPRPAVILPKGRLNVHEEFPAEVAQAVLAFARELPRK